MIIRNHSADEVTISHEGFEARYIKTETGVYKVSFMNLFGGSLEAPPAVETAIKEKAQELLCPNPIQLYCGRSPKENLFARRGKAFRYGKGENQKPFPPRQQKKKDPNSLSLF